MRGTVLASTLILSAFAVLVACKSSSEKKRTQAAPATPVASASSSARLPPPARRNWTRPSGPALAILPGQGVGPIRIGATVATIERHMKLPCDVKTPEVCRYIGRGVEFWLENGATKTIHVHRAGRVGKDAEGRDQDYGFFNGAIPPDLKMGMVPKAIQEYLGPPKRVEQREVLGEALNVELHHYDGLRVEYDRLANGNLVMGGILVVKDAAGDAGMSVPTPGIR